MSGLVEWQQITHKSENLPCPTLTAMEDNVTWESKQSSPGAASASVFEHSKSKAAILRSTKPPRGKARKEAKRNFFSWATDGKSDLRKAVERQGLARNIT